jgi:anti-anti-sigma factor
MADCPYLDPGGLRVLLSLVRRTQAQGGALYLAELSPRVARDLEITRMIKGFTVSPSVEEALQAAAELRHPMRTASTHGASLLR